MRFVMFFLALASAYAQSSYELRSPDGNIGFVLSAEGGQLSYTVSYRGKPVMDRSVLGLEIQDQPELGAGMRITSQHAGSIDETYSMVHGKANPIRNFARTLIADVEETSGLSRKLSIEARAYNDGVAFRYLIPSQPRLSELRLVNERTEFRFAKEATTYPLLLRGFRTSYEDNYHILPLTALHPESLIALPFTAELPGTAWVAILEANINNYTGMYLRRNGRSARSLYATLAPSLDEPGIAVRRATPVETPWRVILIGAQAGRLVESTMVTNLNPPPAIADLSWIRPGKTSWDWWSGSYAAGVNFTPGMNTATMEHYIDFSAEAGFPYLLIDAGWATPGSGPNDSGSDLTRPQPNIDMPAILAHAKQKNVRIWLWAHWSDISRQMDEVFPLFEKWGVAGVKIDFMDRDDQWMVNFYRRVLEKAAAHHLMIDFHGAFKPDGIERTWPNLLTREGVLGAEYNKWSARVTPDHDVMLAFTRMLAGPMDYTPGGFHNATREQFEPRNRQPMVQGTRAHALALYVVFESGLQMVSDYPEMYHGENAKDFAFIQSVPVTWDETRVLGGQPGDSISIARRSGREWFVGSITGWGPKTVDLPLEFLGRGEFLAEIYSDAPDAAENPTHTAIERKRVNSATVLHVNLAPGGGQAIHIWPAQ